MPHLPYLLLQVLACAFFSAATLNLNSTHISPNDIHAPSSLMRSNLQYPSNRSPIARDLHELQNGWVRTIWHSSLRLVYNVQVSGRIKLAAFHSEMLTRKFVQVGRTEKFLSLLPVEVAASVLEIFYNVVIDSVRQKWIQQQPVNSFTITWQNIELEFYSATGKIPVRPRQFVAPSSLSHGSRSFSFS